MFHAAIFDWDYFVHIQWETKDFLAHSKENVGNVWMAYVHKFFEINSSILDGY